MNEPRFNVAAQVERTVLSWNRTALAVAANGALIVREGVMRDLATVGIAGAAVVAGGAMVWIISIGRYPSVLERRASHLIAGRRRVVLAATLFVIALSAFDLGLVLSS